MSKLKDGGQQPSASTGSSRATVNGSSGDDDLLSVIVLAYNDAPSLPALLQEIDSLARTEPRPFEIIVVDDGSTDGTADSVARADLRSASVRVVRHATNRGVGAGLPAASRRLPGRSSATWTETPSTCLPISPGWYRSCAALTPPAEYVRDERIPSLVS